MVQGPIGAADQNNLLQVGARERNVCLLASGRSLQLRVRRKEEIKFYLGCMPKCWRYRRKDSFSVTGCNWNYGIANKRNEVPMGAKSVKGIRSIYYRVRVNVCGAIPLPLI